MNKTASSRKKQKLHLKTDSSIARQITAFSQHGLLLSALLLLVACGTSRKVEQPRELQFAGYGSGFTGILVYDPTEQKVIYEHNADNYFTPASNIKLLTFYTGLKMLGDSVPALKYITINDSLIFWGTGDPTLLRKDFAYSPTLSFLKGRKETLYYATPDYNESRFAPGWAWDDYNSAYSAERASFPIYGNVVSFSPDPRFSYPSAHPAFFQSFMSPDAPEAKSSGIRRDPDANVFTYNNAGEEKSEQRVPFRHSHELAVALLQDTLKREVNLLPNLPKKRSDYETLYSVPTDSLFKIMLQESDNFIAEQILLLSSGTISDSLQSSGAIKFMKENYLNNLPHEIRWVDGSGLSRYNLITPRTLVALLDEILREVPEQRLFNLLPAGGVSGTLKNSYHSETPYIFAKTGTLGNVHNLSGYLRTREGKILIFSYMNNNYMIPTSQIKKQMEALLKNVHSNY